MAGSVTPTYPPPNRDIPTTFRVGGTIDIRGVLPQDVGYYEVWVYYENDNSAATAWTTPTQVNGIYVWEVSLSVPPAGNGRATVELWSWDAINGYVFEDTKPINGLTNVTTGAIYGIPPNEQLGTSFEVQGQITEGYSVICYLKDGATILAAGIVSQNGYEWTAYFYDRPADDNLSILAECWDTDGETKVAEHTVNGVSIGP